MYLKRIKKINRMRINFDTECVTSLQLITLVLSVQRVSKYHL